VRCFVGETDLSRARPDFRLYARLARGSDGPHVVLKRSSEKSLDGTFVFRVQAHVPSAELGLLAASSEVVFRAAAALPNIETFADDSELVVDEPFRSAGIGALVMREMMAWARELYPGRPFGTGNGYVGAIQSRAEWNTTVNAARRLRLLHEACGFSLTVLPDGSGTVSFDDSRHFNFEFLDKMFTRPVKLRSFSARDIAESVAFARAASDSGFIFL
jgi:GNAT superfamily N-acetyltransferase